MIINENILFDMLRNFTGGWYLDIKYFEELIDENNLDFDDIYENVEMNIWRNFTNINYFIYEALSQIANKFIESNKELFDKYSDEYEIYTNYIDSHIWFTSDEVQSKFEDYF